MATKDLFTRGYGTGDVSLLPTRGWAFASGVTPTVPGTEIINAQATSAVPNNYEICSRTGFRQYPYWHPDSALVKDGYGEWVRKKSADDRHPQDNLAGGRSMPHKGPQNAENDDSFIATSIAPEDL